MRVFRGWLYWLALTAALCALGSQALGHPQGQTLQEKLGYPANARLLIIHADDFGMSHSVDLAISQCLEHHWVTSASVMVATPWFPEALAWARKHPDADLGIHMALNSEWDTLRWGPVAPDDQVSSLLDPHGYFFNDPSRFTHVKMHEVETELHAQVDKAHAQGLHFSHLDSHMIALTTTQHLYTVYERVGHDYDLPILAVRNGDFAMPQGVSPTRGSLVIDEVVTMNPGIPKGQWLTWYEKTLAGLKPGIYELVVHPAYDDAEMRGVTLGHPDWGAAWRQRDFDMLRSAQFIEFLRTQKFTLVNWTQLSAAYRAHVQPHY